MASSSQAEQDPRRTSADQVFDQLQSDIVSLRLLPGTKLSESEIAKQSDVSRQPVREAFIRLNNLGLLTVRPQKATLVRKISIQEILNARFIRTAVEIEVVRKACNESTDSNYKAFEANLDKQTKAAKSNDTDAFHALDYDFHQEICIAADSEFAFETIASNKSQVDRLCMLCLANKQGMLSLVEDHSKIFDALKRRDAREMIDLTRLHLSRLDGTLKKAREEHGDFFED